MGPHLQKDVSQLESAATSCHILLRRQTNRAPGCVDNVLNVHCESLERGGRKNNCLSLLHKINTSHVDNTIDQHLQRSDPKTRGGQRFRHARADDPALYHSFFLTTLRLWNSQAPHRPIGHLMPRGFQGWPSCLNTCQQTISS